MSLSHVLASVSAGQPFRLRNARRLALLAGAVALGGFVAPRLPQVSGLLVLHRLG